MPMPQITITFRETGIEAIQRSQKGVVALILVDQEADVQGAHRLTSVAGLSEGKLKTLSDANKEQVRLAFMGYMNPPRVVLLYVVDDEEALDDALYHFATQSFDYLVGPPGLGAAGCQSIVSWIKSERLNDHLVKAVLPDTAADCEAIVNFSADDIVAGEREYTAEEYCARMAGLLAGTPMSISATYAPLPEVTDCGRLTKDERDAAVDQGKFLIWHDGKNVLTGRAVNSMVTTSQEKGEKFKKIKIVEVMDMIANDIRQTARENYIGKYTNSYDNKCLLVVAIQGYLEELERGGLLEQGSSLVEIDLAAQEAYLKSKGIDTSAMSEQEIKEANTGSGVYLHIDARGILDAIEDIRIDITI